MINFSELLWTSGKRSDPGRKNGSAPEPEEIRIIPALEHVPVETTQLKSGSKLAQLTRPQGVGADRFRFLRMRLREIRQLTKLQSLTITSSLPEEGKSTVALCLATALAEGGRYPTLLIDGDLHHSSLATNLTLRSRPGLAECLGDDLDPMSQIVRVEPLGFHLLKAGKPRGNPTELLQLDALSAVIKGASRYFDWILIDTPPVLPLTDALLLSRQVDAALLVVRAGRTSRENMEEAIKLIGQNHVFGILLNGAEDVNRHYSKYYTRHDD